MEFTQVTAAKDLGWTQGAISHYLNDLIELNPSAIIKFANFLDVDPREIDPEIEKDLPSVEKIPIAFNAMDMTKPIRDYHLDRKIGSSLIVRVPNEAPFDSILFKDRIFIHDEVIVKLVKPRDLINPKAYAARMKDHKKLHFFLPEVLTTIDKTNIHTLWAVLSATFY
jgi:transcriptional regulator with XRE-family HTH domain